MSEVKKIATRESYGNALAELGAQNPNIVVLDADLAGATKTGVFKKAFPERHIDCGIAEGNMMGVAAGLATCGKIPFASSFAMFAGHRKLDNLVVIVDNNGLQIDGKIDDVCSPYPIDKKFEAFNFHVINVADGNDMDQLKAAFDEAKATKGMPTAIIMKTVKGKGVSFMENQAGWHGKAPNDEQYAQAMEDLEKVGEALCQK